MRERSGECLGKASWTAPRSSLFLRCARFLPPQWRELQVCNLPKVGLSVRCCLQFALFDSRRTPMAQSIERFWRPADAQQARLHRGFPSTSIPRCSPGRPQGCSCGCRRTFCHASPAISWSIRSDGFIGSLWLEFLSRFHVSSFICRFLGNESSNGVAFPHPQSRKDHCRNEDKPSSRGVARKFVKRTINITEYRDAKDDVNPAKN